MSNRVKWILIYILIITAGALLSYLSFSDFFASLNLILAGLIGIACTFVVNSKVGNRRVDLIRAFIIGYVILSLFGSIAVIDNRNNFGADYGRGSDDSRYYEKIIAISEGANWDETGLFEYSLAPIAYYVKYFKGESANLLELLPFTWMYGALVFALSYLLACVISGMILPLLIAVISLLFYHTFADAMIHLYRDGLLYIFYILFLLYVYRYKYINAIVPFLLVGVMRGANLLLLTAAVVLRYIVIRVKKKTVLYSILTIFCVAGYYLVFNYGQMFIIYGSDISRTSRYSRAFADYSAQDLYTFRQNHISSQMTEGSFTYKMYNTEGIIPLIVKPGIYVLYPLTIPPLVEEKVTHSTLAVYSSSKGIYLFNLIKILMISSLIITIPFIVIGLWYGFCEKGNLRSVALLYIVSLFLVANISGQLRHGLTFAILNPALVSVGYQRCLDNRYIKLLALVLGIFVFTAILAWNYYRYV